MKILKNLLICIVVMQVV